MTGMDVAERDVARRRLAALNVDGWRAESAHGCDGTEEGCAATCPIQVQVRVSPDEIIDAIVLDALVDREARLAAVEALADEPCENYYDVPGQDCITAGPEVFAAEACCPCRVRAALHPDPSEAKA